MTTWRRVRLWATTYEPMPEPQRTKMREEGKYTLIAIAIGAVVWWLSWLADVRLQELPGIALGIAIWLFTNPVAISLMVGLWLLSIVRNVTRDIRRYLNGLVARLDRIEERVTEVQERLDAPQR